MAFNQQTRVEHAAQAMAPHGCEEKLKAYLLELFPEPIVFRNKITAQSKGLISSRTMANYDCKGGENYPLTKFTYNGRVCYDRDQFVEFLLSKLIRKVGVSKKVPIDQLIEAMGTQKIAVSLGGISA